MDMDRSARNLTAARLAMGMSQRELARQAGVSPSVISSAERGINRMQIDTWQKVAQVLGTTVDRLTGASMLHDDTADYVLDDVALQRLLRVSTELSRADREFLADVAELMRDRSE